MLPYILATGAPASASSIWVTIAIAVIGSSALAAGFTGWLNRKKISREAESIQLESMDKVMTRLNLEITRQDTLIETLRREIDSLTRRLDTAEGKASSSEQRANAAEEQARKFRLEVVGLQYAVQRYAGRVTGLEHDLRAHGVEVPEWVTPEIPDVDAELRRR